MNRWHISLDWSLKLFTWALSHLGCIGCSACGAATTRDSGTCAGTEQRSKCLHWFQTHQVIYSMPVELGTTDRGLAAASVTVRAHSVPAATRPHALTHCFLSVTNKSSRSQNLHRPTRSDTQTRLIIHLMFSLKSWMTWFDHLICCWCNWAPLSNFLDAYVVWCRWQYTGVTGSLQAWTIGFISRSYSSKTFF